MPKGTDFNIEEGLECYQNDEEVEGVRNVGNLPEELCDIIWNITRHDINRKRLREQPPVIKGDQHPQDPELITKKAYMSSMWHGSIFLTQDRVVADHFWICGNKSFVQHLLKCGEVDAQRCKWLQKLQYYHH